MKDQLNNENGKENVHVEFGVEFGDINANKVMELPQVKEPKKRHSTKKKK